MSDMLSTDPQAMLWTWEAMARIEREEQVMQIVASFTGRGVDTLKPNGDVQGRDIARNLAEGIVTGRVRWFAVIGAGVESPLSEATRVTIRNALQQQLADAQRALRNLAIWLDQPWRSGAQRERLEHMRATEKKLADDVMSALVALGGE